MVRKEKNNKNKKGELTTQQLVMLIILILSFAVILFFIFRLGLGKTTDTEICRDSVLKKSNVFGKLSGELNCKTSYTCISGGGQCSEITATSTVNVDVTKPDEIYKAIAEEMANCWWMFGEGKLGYGTGCAICSHIEFDDKIKSTYSNGISYREFLESLTKPMNIQKSNENYLYYLYGVSSLNSLFTSNDKYSSWQTDYYADTKIQLQGKFMVMTQYKIAPQFPFRLEQVPSLGCSGNFLTKG